MAERASVARTPTRSALAGNGIRWKRRPSVVRRMVPARPTTQHTVGDGDTAPSRSVVTSDGSVSQVAPLSAECCTEPTGPTRHRTDGSGDATSRAPNLCRGIDAALAAPSSAAGEAAAGAGGEADCAAAASRAADVASSRPTASSLPACLRRRLSFLFGAVGRDLFVDGCAQCLLVSGKGGRLLLPVLPAFRCLRLYARGSPCRRRRGLRGARIRAAIGWHRDPHEYCQGSCRKGREPANAQKRFPPALRRRRFGGWR